MVIVTASNLYFGLPESARDSDWCRQETKSELGIDGSASVLALAIYAGKAETKPYRHMSSYARTFDIIERLGVVAY